MRKIIASSAIFLLLSSLQIALGEETNSPSVPELRGALAIPVETEPAAATLPVSAGEQWHRATLKLTGSMCPACLLELQQKLRKVAGIAYAKVERSDNRTTKTIPTVIIFDVAACSIAKLGEVIKSEKYKFSVDSDTPYKP